MTTTSKFSLGLRARVLAASLLAALLLAPVCNEVEQGEVSAALDAPPGLTATGADLQVQLSWSPVARASGYRLWRGPRSGAYTQSFELGDVTSYTDTVVANAVRYFYAVSARDEAGVEQSSTEASAVPGDYSGVPFLIAPAHDARPQLGMSFEWSDPAASSSYYFLLRDLTTHVVVHSAALSSTSGACSSGTTCVLSPGMLGYPSPVVLDTGHFEWTVISDSSWASGGAGNYNFLHPILPEAGSLRAEWVGSTLSLHWPAVAGAVSYHAAFMNWAFVTSSEVYPASSACVGEDCTGTADVSQIPFGTVHVRLEVCGKNGACSSGITTDTVRACPDVLAEPNVITPLAGDVLSGLTSVRWAEASAAERYSIQFQRDDGGAQRAIVKNDVFWRSQAACQPGTGFASCRRTYALSDGDYLALVSAECGGQWGPQKVLAFRVDSAALPPSVLAPPIWTPQVGATTSIQPVIGWAKVPDIEAYQLLVTDSAGVTTTYDVACKTPLCNFDYAAQGFRLEGTYSFGVRIDARGMPLSAPRSFSASTSYVPPVPVQQGPYSQQELDAARSVAISYELDPQVPFSSVTIQGPAGYTYTSPPLARSACSFVRAGSKVMQRCSAAPAALGGPGLYASRAQGGTLSSVSGKGTSWGPAPSPTNFTGELPAPGSRSIYSVFAQNTQFLPATGPFGHGGGASSAWGLSDRQRAAQLHDYVSSKHFDVVVLSELFAGEAQEELSLLMRNEYPHFAAHLDTAGIASLDEAFAEQDSGLAIFSKFAPSYVAPGATSNYQGTSDTLNELDSAQGLASFALNDFMWYKQYGECEGTDCMAAKAVAGIRLQNPKTGGPLFIAWTHTQSATDNITDSYAALAHQARHDARPVVELMLAGAPVDADALLLGDWNLNMPASVGRHPRFHGPGSNSQTDGGADLSRLYSLASVDHSDSSFDAGNPHFAALLPDPPAAIGEPASGLPKTVFQQYRLAFDPRDGNRLFPGFYDLWLENPAGDPGLSFDVTGRRSHINCTERDRETCGLRHYDDAALDKFDTGSRYDSVLAHFARSNIPNAPGTGSYPRAPSNWEGGSCVQHVSLARDYLYSDHFGTIIEVGPAAPYCNPATAKADPHLWRVPNSLPLPDPDKHGFDKEAGIHAGHFKHGGANEWFFIGKSGAFDIINEGSDAGMDGLIVEAFRPKDISDPIAIADATQHVDGYLPGNPGCSQETNDASISNPDPETGGMIADECAGADTRVTYRVPPGGLYLRVVPADPARRGKRCETCTGNYQLRFRERTCRGPQEAVVLSSGSTNFGLTPTEVGWFGVDQPQCWFQIELQASTSATDFQTLQIAYLGSGSNQACIDREPAAGSCSKRYWAEAYASRADADAGKPIAGSKFFADATLPPAGADHSLRVDDNWDLSVEPETGRKAYYVRVTRDDPTRAHDAILNYDTDLKSVVFQVVSTSDIEDDYITTVWEPFFGTHIINDPFNNTDEDRIRQFVNDTQIQYDDVELNVDNQGGDYFTFPDRSPDGSPILPGSKRGYGGTWRTEDKIGSWLNYTHSARVEAIEQDDLSAWDWVVADHLQCGKQGQSPPDGGWQAARFQELWTQLPLNTNADGNRFSGESFDYNDICGGDEGRVTWEYKFRAGVYRPQ